VNVRSEQATTFEGHERDSAALTLLPLLKLCTDLDVSDGDSVGVANDIVTDTASASA